MTFDEISFFHESPNLSPLYKALSDRLIVSYPDMKTKVSKTQISFSNRFVFAMVSLRKRRNSETMIVSFGLPYKEESPRVESSVQAYRDRWTHHVPINDIGQIDEELLKWIDGAYWFSMSK